MSERLRLTFSDSMRQSEFAVAVEVIQTCATVSRDGAGRTFTVVAKPNKARALRGFLEVWKGEGLLEIGKVGR